MIKGYTAEEIAEITKEKLEDEYDNCNNKWADILRLEETLKQKKVEYHEAICDYRRHSVDRVLAFIRSKKITDEHELEILLCHCQNKLNGNIDGMEITLKRDKEKK